MKPVRREQDRQYTCNVKWRRLRLKNCSGNPTMHSACVVAQLLVTLNYIKIFTVAQQRSYGKLISHTTTQIIRASFLKKLYSN